MRLPSFLRGLESTCIRSGLFVMSLHKTNLYFIFLKKILHSDGKKMLFLKEGQQFFSGRDKKNPSLVCAGHCASLMKR